MPSTSALFIGLMSGTSLDGVDGVLAAFPGHPSLGRIDMLSAAYISFPEELRTTLMQLQTAGENEIHQEALAANALAKHYAECIDRLLDQAGKSASDVTAIGVHGQTIRHRPECGYTRQVGNPALLAELCNIDVIADFRSRDIAAGGQGAPLVPAFHQAMFASADEMRVVANIGGISNISILPQNSLKKVIGFDTGPGNVLLDAWTMQHLGTSYDANGAWGATGRVAMPLLDILRSEPFFAMPPPKSTGRDLFHPAWLHEKLKNFSTLSAADVQATLTAFTATTLADAVADHAGDAKVVYVCGGGAYNEFLMRQLQQALAARALRTLVKSTVELGVSPNHVEALAFAWLAQRFKLGEPGNLPSATGAKGPRVLGALYPA